MLIQAATLSDFRKICGEKNAFHIFYHAMFKSSTLLKRIRFILAVSSYAILAVSSYALANSLDFCCLTFIIFINVRVNNAEFSRSSRSRELEVHWSQRSSTAAPERRGVPTKPLLLINVSFLPQQQLICEPPDGQTGRRLLGCAGSHLSHRRPHKTPWPCDIVTLPCRRGARIHPGGDGSIKAGKLSP